MTPLLLVPGLMCDARLFAPQIAAFSGNRSVQIAAMSRHDTIAEIAQTILSHAPARFALCGLSMGGIVAMDILRQAPERVERIALLDTNPLAEADAIKARRKPQMSAAQNGHLARILQEEMIPFYLADGPRSQEIADTCMEMALGLGPDVFVHHSRALMGRRDQTETLKHCGVPALVLCGEEDRLCPVARHDLMASLLGDAHLVVIKNAGHLPTLEQPNDTNAAIKHWLER